LTSDGVKSHIDHAEGYQRFPRLQAKDFVVLRLMCATWNEKKNAQFIFHLISVVYVHFYCLVFVCNHVE